MKFLDRKKLTEILLLKSLIDEIEIEFLRLGQNPPNPNAVLFLVECKYQDKNGDDSWDGYVDVVVIAEID